MSIEDDAKAAVGWVESHLPGHAKAAPTGFAALPRKGQPIPSQPSAPSQPEVPPVSVLSTIHNDLSKAGSAIEHAWPILTQVVTNPQVDELVEVALTAIGAGVEAAAFAAAIDALNGAIKRKAGTADQVAAAVDAGQQAAQQQPAQPPQASFTPADSATAQAPVVR